MRDQPTGDDNSFLPPSQEGRIDAVCDRFERAWKAGQRPVVVDYLVDVAEADRAFVRAELIALDIAYRKRSGEPATEADYDSSANHTDSLGQPAKTVNLDASSNAPAAPSPSENPTNPALTPNLNDGKLAADHVTPTSDVSRSRPPRAAGGVPGAPRLGALPDIPGYRLVAEIGRGGMGVVYRAEHLALKRIVAMKMVLAGRLAHARELNRFRFEAESVARLQHPHIVQVYEIGEHNGLPFFTLEYVDGGSLAHQLAHQPQSGRASAALVRTLALAVHGAHQRGILHRDLKPANVLLTAAGAPKITDFGLAKRLDEDSGRTRSGDLIGTPSYMAPEQASGKSREMGTWTDVNHLKQSPDLAPLRPRAEFQKLLAELERKHDER